MTSAPKRDYWLSVSVSVSVSASASVLAGVTVGASASSSESLRFSLMPGSTVLAGALDTAVF